MNEPALWYKVRLSGTMPQTEMMVEFRMRSLMSAVTISSSGDTHSASRISQASRALWRASFWKRVRMAAFSTCT